MRSESVSSFLLFQVDLTSLQLGGSILLKILSKKKKNREQITSGDHLLK